jgi:hypothetical protein
MDTNSAVSIELQGEKETFIVSSDLPVEKFLALKLALLFVEHRMLPREQYQSISDSDNLLRVHGNIGKTNIHNINPENTSQFFNQITQRILTNCISFESVNGNKQCVYYFGYIGKSF